MRKIPTGNYFFAVLIMIITLVLTFTLAKFYYNSTNIEDREYLTFLSEVKPDELNNYIVDNHDVMIYMTDSENSDKKIDSSVEKILTKSDHVKEVVYLNLSGLNSEFYDTFSSKYNVNNGAIKTNSFVIIKDEKVKKIINLNERNVKQLDRYIDTFFGE